MANSKRVTSTAKPGPQRKRAQTANAYEKGWNFEVNHQGWHEAPSMAFFREQIGWAQITREEAREWIVRTWKEFFRVADPASANANHVQDAIRFWQVWPELYWLHRPRARAAMPDSFSVEGVTLATGGQTELDTTERLMWLDIVHEKAESIILIAAERAGLDCSSIARSGALCRDALMSRPELGELGQWPECLNRLAKVEPREARDAIHKAKDTIIRLQVRLEGLDVSDGDPPEATPQSRCAPMKMTEIAARILNKKETKGVRTREAKDIMDKCELRKDSPGKWSIRLDMANGALSVEQIANLQLGEWPPTPEM